MVDMNSAFKALSEEARDLFLPSRIRELDAAPSPLVFLREYVMPNIPVIIRGGVQHWPALKKWSDQYLTQVLGDKTVTVAMTPNGYADAPVGDHFVLPHEEQMKMRDFLRLLNDEEKGSQDVVYIQKQNSSFTDEFSELIPDAAEEILWASEAFGTQPDAINFWMGGNRSITSTHKDPYENMYAVVRGSKTFTLFPPTSVPFMPYAMFSLAKYQRIRPGLYDIVGVRNEDEDCDCCRCTKLKEQDGLQNRCSFLNGSTSYTSGEGKEIKDQDSLINVRDTMAKELFDQLESLSGRKEDQLSKVELENLCRRFKTVCNENENGDSYLSEDVDPTICSILQDKDDIDDALTDRSRCKDRVNNNERINEISGNGNMDLLVGSRAGSKSVDNYANTNENENIDSDHRGNKLAESRSNEDGNNIGDRGDYLEEGDSAPTVSTKNVHRCRKEPSKIPWIACNPLKKDPRFKNFFENANPVVATVNPGDLLYLPSLWFHHVQQENGTVAVNYWYDMSYDTKYVYFKFLERLSQPHLNSA